MTPRASNSTPSSTTVAEASSLYDLLNAAAPDGGAGETPITNAKETVDYDTEEIPDEDLRP